MASRDWNKRRHRKPRAVIEDTCLSADLGCTQPHVFLCIPFACMRSIGWLRWNGTMWLDQDFVNWVCSETSTTVLKAVLQPRLTTDGSQAEPPIKRSTFPSKAFHVASSLRTARSLTSSARWTTRSAQPPHERHARAMARAIFQIVVRGLRPVRQGRGGNPASMTPRLRRCSDRSSRVGDDSEGVEFSSLIGFPGNGNVLTGLGVFTLDYREKGH